MPSLYHKSLWRSAYQAQPQLCLVSEAIRWSGEKYQNFHSDSSDFETQLDTCLYFSTDALETQPTSNTTAIQSPHQT
jgi:predicted heme/steroid binding protein